MTDRNDMKNINFEIYESALLRERYYRYTHPSGLEIYVFSKKLCSTYAVLGTRYGSIDNTFGVEGEHALTSVPDGIAHFLEHKLFANEDGSDSFEHFSALGADANAYTSFNKTAYLFSCTDNFEASLGELIDFVTHPYFTEESVRKEQGIIAQEIKMYDDSPAEVCYYGMLESLYERHSIRRNICGSVDSISRITPDLLYECYRVFYNTENMALIVCGDVEPEAVVRIADGHLPRQGKSIGIIRPAENELEGAAVFKSRSEKKMKVSKPILNIGIKDTDIPRSPVERLKKDAAMSILNEMLFARSGELYSSLFESGMISPEISYCYTINDSFAFNSIAAEADEPEAVFERIKAYIESATLREEDFERGKRVMYAEFVKEFDSTESIANNLLSFIFDGSDMLGYANIIAGVTFDDVKELFGRSFKDEYFTMSVVYPLD
ncbi:MAG: insulinase family protein [Clostridia bacterium]|nr:insulinase family protein [Clostridia bacterium]